MFVHVCVCVCVYLRNFQKRFTLVSISVFGVLPALCVLFVVIVVAAFLSNFIFVDFLEFPFRSLPGQKQKRKRKLQQQQRSYHHHSIIIMGMFHCSLCVVVVVVLALPISIPVVPLQL